MRSFIRVMATLSGTLAIAACRGASTAPSTAPSPAVPPRIAESGQLLVVTTPGWSSTIGTLRRFSRETSTDPWHPEGATTPVVVGRTGLAWGEEFDALADPSDPAAPHKHEGDGKSPAGVFPLDTAFGFAPPSEMRWVRLPYAQMSAASDCVDDTTSSHYNTVVDRGAVSMVDWNSAEHMRGVWQYEIGVIVGYNAAPPRRGRGSCIFLHIWDGPASHTAGCTAFDRDELRRVIAWLDPRRRPVLVQMPSGAYDALAAGWGLPSW